MMVMTGERQGRSETTTGRPERLFPTEKTGTDMAGIEVRVVMGENPGRSETTTGKVVLPFLTLPPMQDLLGKRGQSST